MTAADQPTTEASLHERIADTLAYYHCRSVNPKADHPRMGYHAMSEEQRQFLRGRQDEAAAEVVRIIQTLALTEAHRHVATGADPSATLEGLRHLLAPAPQPAAEAEREVQARALRAAANAMDADPNFRDPMRLKSDWVRARADRIERGEEA